MGHKGMWLPYFETLSFLTSQPLSPPNSFLRACLRAGACAYTRARKCALAEQCSAVRCDVVQCGAVHYGVALCGAVQCHAEWFDA